MADFVNELIKTLKPRADDKNRTYSATVSHIDKEGTVWVYVAGSDQETPTVSAASEVKKGDAVNVEWRNNKLYIAGNYSNPSAGVTRVVGAENAAAAANGLAQEASVSAAIANDAANRAVADAETAHTAANEAKESADSAKESADRSLVQLSIVEDVAGTLSWISEHGSYVATTDTTVNPDTVYFQLIDGDYVPIANPDPSANPSTSGWYILDVTDSQADYVMAHLAVTSAGLWVLPAGQYAAHPILDSDENYLIDSDNNYIADWRKDPQNAGGYKVLLSATGMTVFNGEGIAVASYGSETVIGITTGKHVHIDSDSLDIMDGTDTLATFGADGARIGLESGAHQDIMNTGTEIYDDHGKIAAIKNVSDYQKRISISLDGETVTSAAGSSAISNQTVSNSITFDDSQLEEGNTFTADCYFDVMRTSGTWIYDDTASAVEFIYGTPKTETFATEDSTNIKATGVIVYTPPNTLAIQISITYKAAASAIRAYFNNVVASKIVSGSSFRFGTKDEGVEQAGQYGFEHGINNISKGTSSFTSGYGNHASDGAENSAAFGKNNLVCSANSLAAGQDNEIGDSALGYENSCMFLFGAGLKAYEGTPDRLNPKLYVGRYNDYYSGALFAVGNGTSDSSRSNALEVDEYGNANIKGQLTQVPTTLTPTITATTGSLSSATITKCGNVVSLRLVIYNASSIAGGSNIFEGTIETAYRPVDYATGVGYFGNHVFPMQISSAGAITVRHVGSAAITTSSSNTVWVSATYIVS